MMSKLRMAILVSLMLTMCTTSCGDHDHDDHDHGDHMHGEHMHGTPKAGETQFEGMSAEGVYHVHWASTPNPLPLNEPFGMNVMVHKGDHSAMVTDATLAVDAGMPQHGHGMNTTPSVVANGDGTFKVEGMLFHMEGEWKMTFDVGGPDGSDTATLNVNCCQ